MKGPQVVPGKVSIASGGRKSHEDEGSEQRESKKIYLSPASVTITGKAIEVKTPKRINRKPPSRKGTQLTTFSRKSRLKLMRLIHKIDLSNVNKWKFVTLTFPDEYCSLPYAERTYCRSHFMLELERFVGRSIAYVWRCEWEKRKSGQWIGHAMPHYHTLMYNIPYIPGQVISNMWARVIEYEGEVDTDIRAVRKKNGVLKYLAKYVAKAPSLDLVPYLNKTAMLGRAWGICRQGLLPWYTAEQYEGMDEETIDDLYWFAETVMGAEALQYRTGFTLLGDVCRYEIERILRKGMERQEAKKSLQG